MRAGKSRSIYWPRRRLVRLRLLLRLEAGLRDFDAKLTALCREHLVPYKVPVAFHRVDALPRNEAGKLQRAAIKQMRSG